MNGELHIGQCGGLNGYSGAGAGYTNSKGYFYNTDILNNLYVKCNGSLILGNVAYSNNSKTKGSNSNNSNSNRTGGSSNANVGLVEGLLQSTLCNILALSRVCTIPLLPTPKSTESSGSGRDSPRRSNNNGNTRSGRNSPRNSPRGSPRSSPRYGSTGDDGDDGEDITVVNIMQGSALTIDFATPNTTSNTTSHSTRDRMVLLTPTLVPPSYNSYNTATNYNTSSYKTITVQEQASANAHAKNGGCSNIAQCSVKETESGSALCVEGLSSGSITLYIGVCPISAPIIRRQEKEHARGSAYNVIDLGSGNGSGMDEVNTTSIYKRVLTVRIIVIPKTPIYSMEIQQLVAVLEEQRDLNSVNYTSTQCCKEYYKNVLEYDNMKMHKSWKYIVEGSNLS